MTAAGVPYTVRTTLPSFLVNTSAYPHAKMAYGKRTSVWTFVAFIPATIGAVLTIVATTTHYWVESFTERRTGVNSMGLWEICFGNDFAAPWHVQDELGRRYADCNYLLSYELRTLRSWLFTGMMDG